MAVGYLKDLESIYLAGKSPTAYIPYARALLESKAFTKALEVCLHGLENDPESLSGRLLLGEIYFDMGRYDAAQRVLMEAQYRAPRSYRVNLMLVRVLVKRRELDRALDIVRFLRQEHPFDSDLMKIEKGVQDELQMESTSEIIETRKGKKRAEAARSSVEDLMAVLKTAKGVVDFSIVEIGAENMTAGARPGLSPRLVPVLDVARGLTAHLARFNAGSLHHGMIELDKGCALFCVISSKLLLILADSSANLGKLRYAVESFSRG